MLEELNKKYNDFHDDIILKHVIDFENRKTEITIKSNSFQDYEKVKFYKLEFLNVALQHFDFFNTVNVVFEISLYKNYTVFEYSQSEYMTKMKGYMDADVLKKIQESDTLKFYYMIPANNGMNGFIICEALTITEIEL
jgi:hypothetical protein